MPTNGTFSGVSNCYVFKSQLQEYAQKMGLPTPIYETIKDGPFHEPSFESTVVVNNIRYDSLPGFFNRKAAEQSAAEVALMELAKSCEINQCISQPVHETGLCKNLLQEYAQKMNYAIPLYQCQKDEIQGRDTLYRCIVEIGGIQYVGASAKTKKEAEIKAARTALLAIQLSASESSDKPFGKTQLTVIPCKKRGAETTSVPERMENVPKSKKARFKKKVCTDLREKEASDVKGSLALDTAENSESAPDLAQNNHGSNAGIAAESDGDNAKVTGDGEVALVVNGSLVQTEASNAVIGLNPMGETIQAGASQG